MSLFLHLDEQLSRLHLSGMKRALSQQQAQSMLYQEMSFEERLELLLNHELMQREQRKITRLEKQARFRLAGQWSNSTTVPAGVSTKGRSASY